MKTSTIFTSLAAISLASARITGFAAPATVKADDDVAIEILTENFSQTVYDVAITFGLTPTNASYPGALGTVISTKPLGADFSNTIQNITHYVHIPATLQIGDLLTLGASHFSLTGALSSPLATSYTMNITVGEYTSLGNITRSTLVQDPNAPM